MKINHNIYADTRSKGEKLRLVIRFSWTSEGRNHQVKISTPFTVLRDEWDQKRLIVSPRTEYGIAVRDRIIALQDFMLRTNLETSDQYLAAVRAFLQAPATTWRPTRLRDFVRVFIDQNQGKYSDNTIRRYETLDVNLTAFGRPDIMGMLAPDAQRQWFSAYIGFLIGNEYTNPSIKQEFKLISAVKNAFTDTGIVIDPQKLVEHLRDGDTRGTFLGQDELEALQTMGGHSLYTDVFMFMVLTGLRIGEVQTLRPADVRDGVLHYVSLKKGTPNAVPLSAKAMAIITTWSTAEKLFPAFTESKIMPELRRTMKSVEVFQRLVTKTRYRGDQRLETQIPRHAQITLHSARHTYSHLMSKGGMSMDEVGKLLNHGSADTTRRHYEHMESELRMEKALRILETI